MCKIDFDHELGQNSRGNLIYPDIEDLRERHNCVDNCGIVEVEVKLTYVIPGIADAK